MARKPKMTPSRRLHGEPLEPRLLLAVDVQVRPFDHQQEFLGGGAGFTLYSGHLVNGVPAQQRDLVYDWLFEDIQLNDLRIFSFRGEELGNDNADPFDLDLAAMDIPTRDTEAIIFNEAFARNPQTRVMAYANQVPTHLQNSDGSRNLSAPNFHEEMAEWLYANLAITRQRYGIDIAVVDIFNEPDFQGVGQSVVAEVLHHTVDVLRDLVDLHFAEFGVQMPLISGPSTLGTGAGSSWTVDWAANNPATFDNIDVLTTHPYGAGVNFGNYQEIANTRQIGQTFIQNEMEFGHQAFLNNGNPYPDDDLEDDLEAMLALSRTFAIATDAGADGFQVFQGVNPNSQGGKSLVHTPWGQNAVRRKGYFAYRQLTSLQPFGSDVVADQTLGAPDGFHTVAFHHWDGNQVFVSVVNANPTATETTTISFSDNQAQPLTFRRVVDYETSESKSMTVNSEATYAAPQTSWTTTVAPNSVRTFVFDLDVITLPVSELTYLRERNNSNNVPQDGDTEPFTEVLIGHNGNGDRGFGRGIMRAQMEFDLSQLDIPATHAITSARFELTGYRGTVGATDTLMLDLYEYDFDFHETTATWNDPDGDGDTRTGDLMPGGTLGNLLGSTGIVDGSTDDYNANGTTETFELHLEVTDNPDLRNAVEGSLGSHLRLLLDPANSNTSDNTFVGFLDEDSNVPGNVPRLMLTIAPDVDFNNDGALDCQDLAILDVAIGQERHPPEFDLTGDGFVNQLDFDVWLYQAGITNLGPDSEYLGGDANLDGVVDGQDFIVWNDNKFSFNISWCRGDFDRDGVVDGQDFLVWNNNKFQSSTLVAASPSARIVVASPDMTRAPVVEQPLQVAVPALSIFRIEPMAVSTAQRSADALGESSQNDSSDEFLGDLHSR